MTTEELKKIKEKAEKKALKRAEEEYKKITPAEKYDPMATDPISPDLGCMDLGDLFEWLDTIDKFLRDGEYDTIKLREEKRKAEEEVERLIV